MFRRHGTTPDRELSLLANAFHDRLAGSSVTFRTDPPRVDPNNLRGRLVSSTSIGLRERLDRRLSAT